MWTAEIEDRSGPRYRAIAEALAADVAAGKLAEGERLPTQRALAERLGWPATFRLGGVLVLLAGVGALFLRPPGERG